MPELWTPTGGTRRSPEAGALEQRLLERQRSMGEEPNLDLPRDPWQPRWRMDAAWIEFECGCRAERCRDLAGALNFDPVIFRGEPEQAVYDFVCDRHLPGMNKYLGYGGFIDFDQWHRARRDRLMRKVAHHGR